ncbi:MAG: hypothetical protein PHI36_01820 [Bacteroidales bacterium]|nr:hypothetical protein [Bacteroidales bacterium]MDD4575142.1 hypothetical protein [Bacteroidales bacterium]
MKKRIYLIFTALLFLTQNINAQDFQLSEANVRRSNAGQKRSGYSYDYSFHLEARKNLKNIEIKGVWFDSLFYETKTFIGNEEQSSCFNLKKGDQILIKTRVQFVPNELEQYVSNHIPPKTSTPIIKGMKYKALIYYCSNGKRRYHIVPEIENLPQIYMP